jgi:hypothetical protein
VRHANLTDAIEIETVRALQLVEDAGSLPISSALPVPQQSLLGRKVLGHMGYGTCEDEEKQRAVLAERDPPEHAPGLVVNDVDVFVAWTPLVSKAATV